MKKKKSHRLKSLKKIILSFFFILFLSGLFLTYELYSRVFQSNVSLDNKKSDVIYIPTGSDFLDVMDILNSNGILINSNSFKWVAEQKNYINNIKAGRYRINSDFNNNDLVNKLRSGDQDPVILTFNNLRSKEELAGRVASFLEPDSIDILNYITSSSFLKPLQLNNENIACLFIPNSYEFYWNTDAEQFAKRMIREYRKFWNQQRKMKAEKIGLNFYEVSILASIVEKEQNIKFDERPMIAGLYLNRLKKRMRLESDPTLIFILNDYTIKRVLDKDKKLKSPYNTYLNKGLPPGPICIPSINAIDAVLTASKHNYIFMCAKEDFSGYHNFAKNYSQHRINARKYQRALNKRKILR